MADIDKDRAGNAVVDGLSLSEESMGTLGAAAGILTQLKGVLYDIAKNPLIAGTTLVYLSSKVKTVTDSFLKMREEIKANNKEMGTMNALWKDDRGKAFVIGTIASIALKLRELRREVAETTTQLYSALGTTNNPIAATTNIIQKQLDMQIAYGKKAGDQYIETVRELEARLKREAAFGGETNDKRSDLLSKIALVSTTTGVNFEKAIRLVQDSFKQYSVDGTRAFGVTEMMRKAIENGDTAIGSMNENMEFGIELLQRYSRAGDSFSQAITKTMTTQLMFAKMGMTVPQAQALISNQENVGEIGMGGMNKRLGMMGAIGRIGMSDDMKAILKKNGLDNMPLMNSMFVLSHLSDQADFFKFQQSFARRTLGLKGGEGMTLEKWKSLASPEKQANVGFALENFGMTTEQAVNLATQKDITKPPEKEVKDYMAQLSDEVKYINEHSLPEFETTLQQIGKDLQNWLDSLTAWFKKQGISGAEGIPRVAEDVVSTLGTIAIYKASKAGIKMALNKFTGKAATTAVEAATKGTPEAIEGFEKIGQLWLPQLLKGTEEGAMLAGKGALLSNPVTQAALMTVIPSNEISPTSEKYHGTPGSPYYSINPDAQDTVGAMDLSKSTTVNVFLEGEKIATVVSQYLAAQKQSSHKKIEH